MVCNMIRFCGEELLAPLPNPKLEENPLSDGHDCLFKVLAATIHNKILQFHYLAHCDARNCVSFLRSFHREYVPS